MRFFIGAFGPVQLPAAGWTSRLLFSSVRVFMVSMSFKRLKLFQAWQEYPTSRLFLLARFCST
jgi:hypothetical protein